MIMKSSREATREELIQRIRELEMEIQVLENTKNSCPCIKTSGVSCDLKSFGSNDCISKDKIRAKLSKLEKEFDYYANRNPYEFEDGEFDGEQCNDIAIKIGVLKELLKEE